MNWIFKKIKNMLGKIQTVINDDTKSPENNSDDEIKKLSVFTYDTALDPIYNFTKAKVLKVYDGDTITLGVLIDNKCYKFQARIYGIDCDEMRSSVPKEVENAKLAKKYLTFLIGDKVVNINILNNKTVRINGKEKKVVEKYGRWLVDINVGILNISNEMIHAGLARPYLGDTKSNYELNPDMDYINNKFSII